jgi:hypothetical protein
MTNPGGRAALAADGNKNVGIAGIAGNPVPADRVAADHQMPNAVLLPARDVS